MAFGDQDFILPIPQNLEIDKAKSKLGEKLFFDTSLSKNKTVSCFSCHNIMVNGADNQKVAVGIEEKKGILNTPTLFNAVFNFRQNWDGRARTLAEQASGPITNPIEMGHNFADLINELNQTSYKSEFKTIYKDGITQKNIVDAIAEFQKNLITPNAPFDKYLRGDENAITKEQKEGYKLFKSKGCISCHNGINVGGQLYSRFGMVKLIDEGNLGLYNVTKEEEDKYYFKVPSLRNVELTPPYFHNGSVDALYDAVSVMLKYQVGRDTNPDEINKIVEFLKSLNGEIVYAK
ncbi:MAG: cytochrome-c peroxidase [Arcobacteraceae bacterium]